MFTFLRLDILSFLSQLTRKHYVESAASEVSTYTLSVFLLHVMLKI